jgi:hypothetical protein
VKDVRKTVVYVVSFIEASVFDYVICPSVVLSVCTQAYYDAITARIAIDVRCKDSTFDVNKLHDGRSAGRQVSELVPPPRRLQT